MHVRQGLICRLFASPAVVSQSDPRSSGIKHEMPAESAPDAILMHLKDSKTRLENLASETHMLDRRGSEIIAALDSVVDCIRRIQAHLGIIDSDMEADEEEEPDDAEVRRVSPCDACSFRPVSTLTAWPAFVHLRRVIFTT